MAERHVRWAVNDDTADFRHWKTSEFTVRKAGTSYFMQTFVCKDIQLEACLLWSFQSLDKLMEQRWHALISKMSTSAEQQHSSQTVKQNYYKLVKCRCNMLGIEPAFKRLWHAAVKRLRTSCSLVLLRWQEFATRSVAVFFFYMLPQCRCRCQWQILVGVKARVVNPTVLECANCSRHATVEGVLSETVATVSLSTVLSFASEEADARGRRACSWLDWLAVCSLKQMTRHLDN